MARLWDGLCSLCSPSRRLRLGHSVTIPRANIWVRPIWYDSLIPGGHTEAGNLRVCLRGWRSAPSYAVAIERPPR
jgi:hypothetical protein